MGLLITPPISRVFFTPVKSETGQPNVLEVPLSQDASHQKDYYIFSGESLFVTGILGGG